MAQLVEHILGKDEVISSNLITSSSTRRSIDLRVFYFSIIFCFPIVYRIELKRSARCDILITQALLCFILQKYCGVPL